MLTFSRAISCSQSSRITTGNTEKIRQFQIQSFRLSLCPSVVSDLALHESDADRLERSCFSSTIAAVRAALIASLYSPASAKRRIRRTSLIIRRLSREKLPAASTSPPPFYSHPTPFPPNPRPPT